MTLAVSACRAGAPQRRAKRITITITTTTPTRAIHSASFIGPLAAVVALLQPAVFINAPWRSVPYRSHRDTVGLAARARSRPPLPFIVRRRPFVA